MKPLKNSFILFADSRHNYLEGNKAPRIGPQMAYVGTQLIGDPVGLQRSRASKHEHDFPATGWAAWGAAAVMV